jgi:hypothetical protein
MTQPHITLSPTFYCRECGSQLVEVKRDPKQSWHHLLCPTCDQGYIVAETQRVMCADCHGTGWNCVTCGKAGDECQCSEDDQEAFDCQTCEGDGFNEIDDDGE